MGYARYIGWTALVLALGCTKPAKPVTIQVPHGATCHIKSDAIDNRQIVVCVCEGDCWEQSR